MIITLKNIKHSEFASHETHCFTASIYVDGKKSGIVENCGQGGCNDEHWDDRNVMNAVYDHVKTLPPVEVEWGDGTMSQSFDTIIGELVNDWLVAKEGNFSRIKIPTYYKGKEAELFTRIKKLDMVEKNSVCLNVLPIAEAICEWRKM
jgi:hypothetical protein